MSKERDPAVYEAIMASGLSAPVQIVYWALWSHPDGLTRGEIAEFCKSQNCEEDENLTWPKAVSEMVKLGLVERSIKRHCTAANKEDQVWEITNIREPKPIKAPKPSAKRYQAAVEQLEIIMIKHDAMGDGMVTEDLKKLFAWLKDKIPA